MKERILITGAAGLIGSNLCRWLILNTDYHIIGVDDMSGGYPINMPVESERYHFIQGNITDMTHMDLVFQMNTPDYVYHLAAYAAENLSPFIRGYNYKTNLIGTTNIVNACIKYSVKRLVFTSSIAVYGNIKPPFTEDMTPVPNDPYGIAKLACEMDIRVAGEQHNLDWCIVRPFNVYGVRQNIWDKYRNVAGIFMYNHLRGEKLPIFGDGSQTRNFTYVGDILEPMYLAMTKSGCSKQIINLGSEVTYTVKQLAETFAKTTFNVEIEYLPARHEVQQAYCDTSKAKGLLNYKDKTDLFEGLARMWEWAQRQPERERKEWSEFELETGLYPIYKKQIA